MSGLFKPKPPAIKPPAPMPDENDPAIIEAARLRRQRALATGGRRSTIMSSGGASMPGPGGDYSQGPIG